MNVGCHADAHEQAKWFGDDFAVKAIKYEHDPSSIRTRMVAFRQLGAGNPPLHRFRIGLEFALSGHRELDGMITEHARIARSLGEQLELPVTVLDGLGAAYEQWDGKGWPGERSGHAVPLPARIATLAEFTEVAHRIGGLAAVRDIVRRRAGGQFDPALAELVDRDAEQIYAGLDGAGTWSAVIDAEPALAVTVEGDAFDRALTAIANFVDLKSPYTLGHSVAVAQLARAAGEQLGLDADDAADAGARRTRPRLRPDGRLEPDLGATGPARRRRVGARPPLPARDRADAAAGRVAGADHADRRPGTGAARRFRLPARAARLGDSPPRPRARRRGRLPGAPRAARRTGRRGSRTTAAALLRREAQAGRIDGDAAEAVLAAAGHRVRARRDGPAGLTAREVEVLRLLAQGLSNKEIAQRLVISPKTAGTHIEHIYAKIDASSRATASVFAVQHGLLPEEQLVRADT